MNEEVDGCFAVADGVAGRDEASAVGVIETTHRRHSALFGAEDAPLERLLCVAKAILSAVERFDGGTNRSSVQMSDYGRSASRGAQAGTPSTPGRTRLGRQHWQDIRRARKLGAEGE